MSAMSGATPQRVTLVLGVDVDPVAHGFDLPVSEAKRVIVTAVDNTRGLQVAEAHTTTSPGDSLDQ